VGRWCVPAGPRPQVGAGLGGAAAARRPGLGGRGGVGAGPLGGNTHPPAHVVAGRWRAVHCLQCNHLFGRAPVRRSAGRPRTWARPGGPGAHVRGGLWSLRLSVAPALVNGTAPRDFVSQPAHRCAYTGCRAGSSLPLHSPNPMRGKPGPLHHPRITTSSPSARKVRSTHPPPPSPDAGTPLPPSAAAAAGAAAGAAAASPPAAAWKLPSSARRTGVAPPHVISCGDQQP